MSAHNQLLGEPANRLLSALEAECLHPTPVLTLKTLCLLSVKICKHGSISRAGSLSLNLLRRQPQIEVEPASLIELLASQTLLVSYLSEGVFFFFMDTLSKLGEDCLYFDNHDELAIEQITELVVLLDDDPAASGAMLLTPPLPPPDPLIALEELPHYFGKTCLVLYKDETGELRSFTDVLHSYSGNHAYFRNRLEIPVASLLHISPLEAVLKSTSGDASLPHMGR